MMVGFGPPQPEGWGNSNNITWSLYPISNSPAFRLGAMKHPNNRGLAQNTDPHPISISPAFRLGAMKHPKIGL